MRFFNFAFHSLDKAMLGLFASNSANSGYDKMFTGGDIGYSLLVVENNEIKLVEMRNIFNLNQTREWYNVFRTVT